MKPALRTFSVAVFSARETPATLAACVHAIVDACRGRTATVHVVVNGNRALADAAANLAREDGVAGFEGTLEVCFIELGDKAHAWNEYVARLWPGADTAFFVDGYAAIERAALALLDAALAESPNAVAAAGVPTLGRSARNISDEMLRDGGLHGTLYAIRGSALAALRERSFRIPLGLYRNDALLGAVAGFALDPSRNDWDIGRIAVRAGATWRYEPHAWWRPRDLVLHAKRWLRQAQGALENRAYREHLAVMKRAPEALPDTAADLVLQWAAAHRGDALRMIARNPLCAHALWKLSRPRDWSLRRAPPLVLATRVAD